MPDREGALEIIYLGLTPPLVQSVSISSKGKLFLLQHLF